MPLGPEVPQAHEKAGSHQNRDNGNKHILKIVLRLAIGPGVPPQGIDLLNRSLIERSMFPGENAGKGQTVDVAEFPGGTGGLLFVIHSRHPSGHNPASRSVQKRLRGVKIKAAVESFSRPAWAESAIVFIKTAGDIAA